MTSTLRAFGVAASLLMGTALAASAAVTPDNPADTATNSNYTSGPQNKNTTNMGTRATDPSYQTTERSTNGLPATVPPHVDNGNAAGDNGSGSGGGSGAGGGGAGGGGAGGGAAGGTGR